jgi:hypothetical protein
MNRSQPVRSPGSIRSVGRANFGWCGGRPKPEVPVAAIEAIAVGAEQPLHTHEQIGLRRPDDPVKAIGNQAMSVHLPARLFAGLL